jgi:hypothetical protein
MADRLADTELVPLVACPRRQGDGGAKSFDDIAALLRVCHEFINRHLALGLVVNVPGTPKSLHFPIAALDSCRIVSHSQSMENATCRAQRHILIDFPQQRVFHICVHKLDVEALLQVSHKIYHRILALKLGVIVPRAPKTRSHPIGAPPPRRIVCDTHNS